MAFFIMATAFGWSAEDQNRSAVPLYEKGYTVFPRHYMERGNARTLPDPGENNKPLAIFAAPGEYEPVSFAVRAQKNLEDVAVTIASDLKGPDGAVIAREHVEIRCVELMKRWLSPNEYKTIECYLTRHKPKSILADTTQRYWLTVYVPEQARPGFYETSLVISPKNTESTTLPLKVEVLPISLSLPEGMNYFMYYSPGYLPEKLCTLEYQKMIFEDMKRHGMTTTTLCLRPNGGNLIEPDGKFFAVIPTMDALKEVGLVGNGSPVIWEHAASYGSSHWLLMIKEGGKRQWPEMLFYILDEPHTEEQYGTIRKIMEKVAEFRENYPDIKLRTTTALPVKLNQEINQYYDVWIVGLDITEKELHACRQAAGNNKELWRYDGMAPVDAKTDRYYFGFWSWKSGMKGIGRWAYFDTGRKNRSGADSPWLDSADEMTECTTLYSYVYPSSEELVPTIGWESVREGVDDYRYIRTLEKVIELCQSKHLSPQLVEESRRLIKEIAGKIDVENMHKAREFALKADTEAGTLWSSAGLVLFDRQPPEQGFDYDGTRYRIAQQIIKLQQVLHTTEDK